ncbi:MAG: lipid-A-disaccharide synthase [Pseudomonadales bacterium]|nr:lipid-A-disaccharide synthase [Pseudomonadales bacterium]
MSRPLKIAIIAGEASGDILGAGLIEQILQRYPDATFEGIAGPLMLEYNVVSLAPMERLSVMGLVEVLGRLRELLKLRKKLVKHWVENPPDVFIGIDAPEFNLGLERSLHKEGIKTVHYVSPSVWAWRSGRVKKIKGTIDLMLTLFPFEAKFYQQHQIPVQFVGHPLADQIPLETDRTQIRAEMGLSQTTDIIALLPGSRAGEIDKLGRLFLEVAHWCLTQNSNLDFVLPCVNAERKTQVEKILEELPFTLPIMVTDGESRNAMIASNAVLMASGTAALEGMLLKRPMVVAYKLSNISFFILSRMVKVDHVSLPNLLADTEVVPEFLQNDATVENIGTALMTQLECGTETTALMTQFDQQHQALRKDASFCAAQAVLELLGR